MTDLPPDLDEAPDIGPRTDPRPVEYTPHEAVKLTHEYVPQPDRYAPILNTEDEDPYQGLGGLTRPDAYFGAIEFDCPTCEAKGKTLDHDGEKCKVWVERTEKWHVRKMPCIARIKLANERGVL